MNESLPHEQLCKALKNARVSAYYPHVIEETFCLAIAKAQAVGLPVIVRRMGALPERVINGRTSFVVKGGIELGERLIDLLTDDELWMRMHSNSLDQPVRTWKDYAQNLINTFSIGK